MFREEIKFLAKLQHQALFPSSCPKHTSHLSIRVRASVFRYSLSFYLLAPIQIIMYYNVLSCIPISFLVNCFFSDHCHCFVFRPISLPFSLSQVMGPWVPLPCYSQNLAKPVRKLLTVGWKGDLLSSLLKKYC